MSEQDEPDAWQQTVPPNHAITCFRVILWLLPSGFAAFSAWGRSWMIGHHYLPHLGVRTWLLLNTIFILGSGWFNALLSANSREVWHGVRNRVILFFVIQPFIISFFLCLSIGWLLAGGE